MDHPIPQDITGFQFKLIGSMTVKQFLYLAVGIIISWFIFVSGLFFLIKWPLILLFGGGGIALAFVPIGGRPMDTMIAHFIKAFFRDSTYVYDKIGGSLPVAQPIAKPKPPAPAATPKMPPQISPEPAIHPAMAPAPKPIAEPQVLPHAEISPAPSPEPQVQHQPLPQAPVQNTTQVLHQAPPPQITPSLNVRQVPASQTTTVGIPATPEVPNLITGIIKDPRNNPLPNILVEIKDKEGNPVRAFKTNGLGHFASATPLLDGTYTIDFEDIKGENKFERIAFEAKGQIVMPFEIISTDKREELRRELFN
jgi:hypothetical protein